MTEAQCLQKQIKAIIPEHILEEVYQVPISEEIMDFMHIYTIAHKTNSYETTKKDSRVLTQTEKLRILSRNI